MRRLVLAAVAMLLVACGGDKATGPEPVTGSYTLRTVNGTALPATFYQDDVEKDQLFAGTISLAADHSWTGSLSVDATAIPGGQVLFHAPIPVSGTYALNASTITITDPQGLSFTGTVTGGTMTLATTDLNGIQQTALVFSK
ncbi:MAG TPA: hypothetical protein VJW73_07625 [Gemmatimonadaceae bacterium]|nr:hypothetical protein [Gemmatimonadaceae bacterium]